MDIETIIKNGYYGPHAYNSNTIDYLPPIEDSVTSKTTGILRTNHLARHTCVQCTELLAADSPSTIEALNSDDPEIKKLINAPGHEMQYWQSLRNPRAVVDVLTDLFCVFMWIGIIFVPISSIYFFFTGWNIFIDPNYYIGLIGPFAMFGILHYTGKYVLKKDWVKDKNNVYLNRRKGVISIPQRKMQPPKEIPFAEFDAYLGTSWRQSGRINYHLILGHRYSDSHAQLPMDGYDSWEVEIAWESCLQFMDISKPLPDIPRFEPFRSKDPVTAAYDKANNRPAD
ncbi:MAG: hypothetical protein GY874_14990, partial [Desulfobacteraceae bacterium]|nr:hypothetical protein [Desulfobacteraceae bacterium]